MDPFNIITFFVGLAGGATAAYIVLQAKTAQAVAEALAAQKEIEVRAVAEADAAAQRVRELVVRLDKLAEDLESRDSLIRDQNITLADTRVALKQQETLALQLPQFKLALEEKDRTLQHKDHELTQLKTAQATFETRVAEFQRQQEELKNAFAKLATDALQKNNELFLQRAKAEMEKSQATGNSELDKRSKTFEEMIKPIKEGLEKYDQKITQFEKERSEAFGAVANHLKTAAQENERLKTETSKLVNALRGAPTARGLWGEVELRRVVEIAGMIEHVAFDEQVHLLTEEGALRPDMVIHLPGNKSIVVDAKVPAKAYLEALDEPDDGKRAEKIAEHVDQMRTQLTKLSRKAYWDQMEASPDFVVMFMPEPLFRAALQQDKNLMEDAMKQRVVLATPMTLLALLKIVAYGWRQEQTAENARQISILGKRVYDALVTFSGHLDRMRGGLDRAVDAYNAAVGSLERTVMSPARELARLGVMAEDELNEGQVITQSTRQLQLPELKPPEEPPLLRETAS